MDNHTEQSMPIELDTVQPVEVMARRMRRTLQGVGRRAVDTTIVTPDELAALRNWRWKTREV